MSGKPAPKSRSNYALFLGDLSIFCAEKDIEDVFQQYGEIVNIRIQRSKETARALSYGFIEFSCETAAVTAMNELNGYVLKGRPLRIRWAAKRNQPVKSENTALQTAATIFVKFASQTGIIVTEEVLREHFSTYGKVLDTTIRTITIDEAFNRSKGYGFVNFVNNAEEDGLAAAYRASAELQNTTINGVNYRCEVGYKHQPQAQGHPGAGAHAGAVPVHAGVHGGSSHSLNSAHLGKTDSDSVSASLAGLSLNTSGNASAGASYASMPHSGAPQGPGQGNQQRAFLPSLSPTRAPYYSNSSVTSAAGASHSPAHSRSHSHSSSGPPSPHPAAAPYFTVNPQVLSSGASVISQGSGGSGMYSTSSPFAPHSPHGHHIVSAISYVPTSAVPVYSHAQQGAASVAQQPGVYVAGPGQQAPYYPAQAGQQGYYVQPPAQGYYGAPGYAPQQVPAATYYGSGHSQQGSFYAPSSNASQDGYYSTAAPAQEGYAPQYYAAGQAYYQAGAPVPMAPAGSPRPSGPEAGAAGPQAHGRARRQGMVPHQMHQAPPGVMYAQVPVPMPVPEMVDGRRSQRNISNKSNISEITSATLNELQCDDDEEIDDEEVPQPPSPNPAANAAPTTVFNGDRGNGYSRVTAPATVPDATTEIAGAGPQPRHLKSTLQTQPGNTTPPVINCKLTARRGRRSASGGSSTTEITAEMLYDLQQQEQRLAKEEDEEGYTEPPTTRAPRKLAPIVTEVVGGDSPVRGEAASATTTADATVSARRLNNTPEAPEPERESTPLDQDGTPLAAAAGLSPVSVIKMLRTPPTHAGHTRRPSSTDGVARVVSEEAVLPAKSISPFTLTADALEQLQKDAEAQDAASGKAPQRRSKRNVSDRSNASDITAALAFMQLEYSEEHFRSLDDDGESYSSASASACVCGKGASSCPFGTTACSCVYAATC